MSDTKIGANALKVLEKRYLAKNSDGEVIETVDGLLLRVAKTIAAADKKYDDAADLNKTGQTFYNLMSSLRFLPNSPTLMNAGRPLGQLSACFVLPIDDSMEAIFEAVKNAALIHKSGGGTGFSFSRLRSNGSAVDSTGGVASGPVSFMRVFNTATEAVKQGGTRRGANMGILRIDHPDILEFIDCKNKNADITNFNISVGLTEAFMDAVQKSDDFALVDPHRGKTAKSLNAREVFDRIVDAAWQNGEPGIIFLDRLNRDNVTPSLGEIESTNPCGEQPLLPFESCNLGSINLVKMLRPTNEGYEIDWALLDTTVDESVHFLDNVIDVNKYPLTKIAETTHSTRKIGLGIMGFADMLLMLGIPYNSDEALELAKKIMCAINERGHAASHALAKTRGAFPLFSQSIYARSEPLRNATITTIAPTGTLSIIAGCSSGIEPVFAYVYTRNIMDGSEMLEVNPILKERLEKAGLYTPEIVRHISEHGTIAHIEEIPQEIRDVFVCSHDISPVYHIRMQAAFQQHTDNAVSKTVNFPSDATRQDVSDVYFLAYKEGCKGVTIYRDGSRESQVLNIGAVKEAADDKSQPIPYGQIVPRPRSEITSGVTERMKIGCGNLYVTVNYDDSGICEVFTSTGKAGGCSSQSEATARLCSVSLRSGISVDEICSQLKGIRCPATIKQSGMSCTSCPDAIAKVVMKVNGYIEERRTNPNAQLQPEPLTKERGGSDNQAPDTHRDVLSACPECGASLEHEGGCVVCRGCGYSKCG